MKEDPGLSKRVGVTGTGRGSGGSGRGGWTQEWWRRPGDNRVTVVTRRPKSRVGACVNGRTCSHCRVKCDDVDDAGVREQPPLKRKTQRRNPRGRAEEVTKETEGSPEGPVFSPGSG